MKVQTTVLLFCFLSGVFLSSVVHAKPSPALMKELIALEKYLEKKQGSDSDDGKNKNQDENVLQSLFDNVGQNNENLPIENGEDKPMNENNNNPGGEEAPQESEKPDGAAPPPKPEEGVPPPKPEEGVTPAKPEEGVPPENAEEEEGEKPQEGNGQSQSEGQVEKGRDQILADLGEATGKIKDALNILGTLDDEFRIQFQNDDRKLNELKANDEQTKEKTIEKLGKLKTAVEDINSDLNKIPSAEKKSVRENAPARRSHLSDTEFLNIVHSLLTNN